MKCYSDLKMWVYTGQCPAATQDVSCICLALHRIITPPEMQNILSQVEHYVINVAVLFPVSKVAPLELIWLSIQSTALCHIDVMFLK